MRKMMKAAVLGAATTSLVLSGALGAATAQAADTPGGNASILSNNLIHVPVSIPINVCGNTLNILGLASSGVSACASVPSLPPAPLPAAPAAPEVPPVAPPVVPPVAPPVVPPVVPPVAPPVVPPVAPPLLPEFPGVPGL